MGDSAFNHSVSQVTQFSTVFKLSTGTTEASCSLHDGWLSIHTLSPKLPSLCFLLSTGTIEASCSLHDGWLSVHMCFVTLFSTVFYSILGRLRLTAWWVTQRSCVLSPKSPSLAIALCFLLRECTGIHPTVTHMQSLEVKHVRHWGGRGRMVCVCVKGQLELTLLSDTQSGHHCARCATTFFAQSLSWLHC